MNGSLTACSGDPIKITCNHNLADTISTTWRMSPPVNCSTIITHTRVPDTPPCGSSINMFQDVSAAMQNTTVLTSTAVVTADVLTSGSTVECKGGNRVRSISVGNISLCVVGEQMPHAKATILHISFNTGQLPPPANPQCSNTPNGLLVAWNAVTDTSCAESPVKYNVTVVQRNDGMLVTSLTDLDDNETEIINKTSTSIDYSISISAKTTIASCYGQPVRVICRKSAANNSSVADDNSSAGNFCIYKT